MRSPDFQPYTRKIRPYAGWILVLVMAVMFLPRLGDARFNTKGEPREALVAVSMQQTGDYVLPTAYGHDIPYKPPMLAWLISSASVLTGGINEFSSRLPSAAAAILLMAGLYAVVLRRTRSITLAITAALVMVTSTEVFRAATACRVDMVLTACLVGALLCLFEARERRGKPGFSWFAALLMTGAVLTKGPVGMALPCLVMLIYFLLRGDSAWRSIWVLALTGLSSLVLPAVWYWLAWKEGGDEFLRLVAEENLGRLTGTMTYDSHLNPWWYNVITLVAGMLPYTLFALFAVFTRRYIKPRLKGTVHALRVLQPLTLFALTAATVVFVFYCFPASKRSVYLLPCYPFLGYFIARLFLWTIKNKRWQIEAYAWVIGSVVFICAWTVWGLHIVESPIGMFLYNAQWGVVEWVSVWLTIVAGALVVWTACRRDLTTLATTLAATVCVYCLLSTTVLPPILNQKSDIKVADTIQRLELSLPVYTFNEDRLMRWYTTAFYLDDRLRRIEDAPESRDLNLLVSERDMDEWQKRFGTRYEVADTLWKGDYKSGDVRSKPLLLHLRAK